MKISRIVPLLALGALCVAAAPASTPTSPARAHSTEAPDPRGGVLDVFLAELYGLVSMSRDGTYPNGVSGLSAATTSCNVGDVDVPWFAAMDEDHPFIGLAMFREENGRLEQIGRNWLKHGFFSLNDDDCGLCPSPAGAPILRVGCSDTYTANNNGSFYDLGPRGEVNPHTAEWTACGSFFDEPDVIDSDCDRDWFGSPGMTEQQLAVRDEDLAHAGATYYYEGMYIVANDDDITNNIGWRRISSMQWNGSQWLFVTFVEEPPFNQEAQPGPVVAQWGDQTSFVDVANDDGRFYLSAEVTDLGGGWWRYEYALYNRTSARGVRSLSIPLNGAAVQNLSFRDLDDDPGNDWTLDASSGSLVASTDDFATNPDANALEYQMLFNVGFEADRPDTETAAAGNLFRPGFGSGFLVTTRGPAAPVDAPLPSPGGVLRLALAGRNPSADGAQLRFHLPEAGTVRLDVRDVTGRRVRRLLDGPAPAGTSQLLWDGRDDAGRATAAGVYFAVLRTADASRTVKITRLP